MTLVLCLGQQVIGSTDSEDLPVGGHVYQVATAAVRELHGEDGSLTAHNVGNYISMLV